MRWASAGLAAFVAAVAPALALGSSSAALPRGHCAAPMHARSPSANVGAYYFDGWAGPPTGFHFAGLRGGAFSGREPLYGWSDSSPATMRRQLAWARDYGVGFFVFDWYYRAASSRDPALDHALANYLGLRFHHGVGFALTYVNTDQPPDDFVIPGTTWAATIARWIGYFRRPEYVRVEGKPLLVIHDAAGFTRQLGGPARAAAMLARLRAAAQRQGLPGVFIVGGIAAAPNPEARALAGLAGEGYDALTQYGYPSVVGRARGPAPYHELVDAEVASWQRVAAAAPVPFLPAVMAGWDPRPWGEKVAGAPLWFQRSPGTFERFVLAAVRYSARHPAMRLPGTSRSVILITAWNELGEGDYIVPTRGACHRYGDALARAVSAPAGSGR